MSPAVRVGVNPIVWSNDDFHDLGGDIPLERCLAEARAAGYAGIELGHKFPREPERLRPLLDAHTKLVHDFDVTPYLFAADLLLTDASSVSSEYALLDRPMVFLDVPAMLESIRAKGRAVDLDTWGRNGGVTVQWPDEAVDAVRWSLAHPRHGSDVRRAMAKDLFYNPGRAADAAVDWIRARLA